MPAEPSRSSRHTRIALARIQAGLSQVELAARSEVPHKTLQRLEAGQVANPGIITLFKLAAALKCTLDDLVEDAWRTGKPIEPHPPVQASHSAGWHGARGAAEAERRRSAAS